MPQDSRNSSSRCTKQVDVLPATGGLANPQRHDDLLNYRLKRLLTLAGAPAIRLCEAQFGIARFEWRLLAALVEEGPQSPNGLARRTGLDGGRISRTLALLAQKNLICRQPVHERERRASMGATHQGRALYESLWPLLASINRRLVAALEPDEVIVLDRCLLKLTEHAARILSEPGSSDLKTQRRLGGSRVVWEAALAAGRPPARS
jgi:DNA-binding MarR family transcriptional regulator